MGDPIFRVGGIASGLDTESIINSLVQVERIPINRMSAQRGQVVLKNAAWTAISTQVSQLRTTLDELRFGGGLTDAQATSNQPEVVTAKVTGTAPPGAFSFTVDQLAATHSVSTDTGLADSTSLVGAGTVTITVDSTAHDVVTDATTTLADLAAAIDDLDIGVDASVLKVADGDHRLALTSTTSGEDAVFTLTQTGTSLGAEQVLSQGANAKLTVGSGAGALEISRSSNVITDLLQGVELELLTTSASSVSVTTERDVEAVADNVVAMFDAANGVLSEVDRLTAFDQATSTAAPLTGDAMVRALDARLNDVLSSTIGALGTALADGSPLSFRREGGVELDRDELVTALTSNYDAVVSALNDVFTADDSRLTPKTTSSSSVSGTYEVVVTDDATPAGTIGGETTSVVGSRFTALDGDPVDLSVDIDLTGVDTSGGPVTIGNISYTSGLLTAFDRFLDDVEGVDGLIARARDEHDARIEDLDDQIDAMELRIERREATFRRQYTAMETALAELQSGASFLSGLISSQSQSQG